ISELEARKFAEENGITIFLETSAKSGDNVQEAFLTGARAVLERVRSTNMMEICAPGNQAGTAYLSTNRSMGPSNNNCSC
ncbi:unnamed protein product, partial [Protopolystoma xenopodis]